MNVFTRKSHSTEMLLCRAGYQTGNGKTRAAAAELVLEQHFFGVVATCHNFLKRVSLDQVFVQPPEKL